MSRRTDTRTAELVDIALLTRAAFELPAAQRYSHIAGLPSMLIEDVFARAPDRVRATGLGSSPGRSTDRRLKARTDRTPGGPLH